MVRRKVNMLQMILDKNETNESLTEEQMTLLFNANSSLEETILSFNSMTVRQVNNSNESIQKWINGDTQSICDMMTSQLKGEVEECEEEAAEEMVEMLRRNIDLKPYQKEMIMRIQQRRMRRRYYYYGTS
jgi:hypothetical protein